MLKKSAVFSFGQQIEEKFIPLGVFRKLMKRHITSFLDKQIQKTGGIYYGKSGM